MYDDEFELTFNLSDEDEASRAPAPEQEPVFSEGKGGQLSFF